jgi:hypothetical protein
VKETTFCNVRLFDLAMIGLDAETDMSCIDWSPRYLDSATARFSADLVDQLGVVREGNPVRQSSIPCFAAEQQQLCPCP